MLNHFKMNFSFFFSSVHASALIIDSIEDNNFHDWFFYSYKLLLDSTRYQCSTVMRKFDFIESIINIIYQTWWQSTKIYSTHLEHLPSHRSHSMQQVVYGICVTTHTGHQQTRDHHVHTVKANHLGHVQTTQRSSQIAKALTSMSIRYRSVSDRCLIHGDLMAFAIWKWTQNTNWKRGKLLVTNNFPLFQFVFFFFFFAELIPISLAIAVLQILVIRLLHYFCHICFLLCKILQ